MKKSSLSPVPALFILAGLALPAFGAIAANEATDANLEQMFTSAKAPADHEAIAAYYDKEAADVEGKAKLHHSAHKTYEKFRLKPREMAHHRDALAKYFQRAAEQAKALAAGHRKTAQQTK